MQTEIRVTSSTERFVPRIVIDSSSDNYDDWVWVDLSEMSEEETLDLAKQMECSPKLIEGIAEMITDLRDRVNEDLRSIWNKVDK